jgi:hypothetical protein
MLFRTGAPASPYRKTDRRSHHLRVRSSARSPNPGEHDVDVGIPPRKAVAEAQPVAPPAQFKHSSSMETVCDGRPATKKGSRAVAPVRLGFRVARDGRVAEEYPTGSCADEHLDQFFSMGTRFPVRFSHYTGGNALRNSCDDYCNKLPIRRSTPRTQR